MSRFRRKAPVAAITTAASDKAHDRVEDVPTAPGPLIERMTALQERVDAIGPADPAFDQKTFSNWMEADGSAIEPPL